MKKLILTCCVVLAGISQVSAQMERISAFVNAKGSESINYETVIPMQIVEPIDGMFNTGDLLRSYPELEIEPELISITLPRIGNYIDTIYIMVFVKDRAYSRRGQVNIMVMGIVDETHLDYFIDDNSDYTFQLDETRFTFTPNIEKKALNLDSKNGLNQFFIFNPIYEPPVSTGSYDFNGSWNNIREGFNILFDVSGTFGAGSAIVSYVPSASGVSLVDYKADLTSFGLFKAGLYGRYKGINLGLSVGFEQVQYSERNKYTYRDDQVSTAYMSGLWMWSKLSFEGTLEIDIRLSQRIMIGPSISAGLWMPVDGRQFDPKLDPPEDAAYIDSWKYEYGAVFKLLISNNSYIKLKAGRINTNVNAIKYLVDYDHDYKSSYKQSFISMGYVMLLTKKQ